MKSNEILQKKFYEMMEENAIRKIIPAREAQNQGTLGGEEP
jgi:hypothetical protein